MVIYTCLYSSFGIIFKNENLNEDMLTILRQFYTYLPTNGDNEVDPQLFAGDQLTVERAVNVVASVSNGYTPEDRLEGMNFQIGDWHAGVKILSVSPEFSFHLQLCGLSIMVY